MIGYFVLPPVIGYWIMKQSGADFARATMGALWLFCMAVVAFVAAVAMFRRIGEADDPNIAVLLFVSAAIFGLILFAYHRMTR